ncbi:SLOG cluster 4 domain-containing protein [Phormidium nigroviride]
MKKIGVFGSAIDTEDSVNQKARKVGEQIARTGNCIITGACTGIPLQAVLGAKSLGGYSMGFSATYSPDNHLAVMETPLELYDEIVWIPQDYKHKDNAAVCRKYRNVSSVAESDAAIFISGRWGTLNELSNAYDMGKLIGILSDTGGMTEYISILMEALKKKTSSQVIFDNDPENLVNQICQKMTE